MEKLEIIKKERKHCLEMIDYYRQLEDNAIKNNNSLNNLNDIRNEIKLWFTRMNQTDYIIYLITK